MIEESGINYIVEELFRVGALRVKEGVREVTVESHRILSNPDLLNLLITTWYAKLNGLKYDVILGVGVEGAVYAAMLAWISRKGVAYALISESREDFKGVVTNKRVLILLVTTKDIGRFLKAILFKLSDLASIPVAITSLIDVEEGLEGKVFGIRFLPLLKTSKVVDYLRKRGYLK